MYQLKIKATVLSLLCAGLLFGQDWRFTDVTAEAGMIFDAQVENAWSGVVAADYNNDGLTDLLVTKTSGTNRLFRNNGDGTFTEVTEQTGMPAPDSPLAPFMCDFDGNGWLDIFLGDSDQPSSKLLYNNGGTFTEDESRGGILAERTIFSPAAGDFDLDGDLDLYIAQNGFFNASGFSQFWRNEGDGSFTELTQSIGLDNNTDDDVEFTPNFADVNNDGWPDLLVVADFNNSQVYINNQDGTFTNTTDRNVITDEGGMGSAVADYDHDGDLDWFVSSIWDPDQNAFKPWGVSSGNRLYKNNGDGTFVDATDEAGVRMGNWGWGSVFGDFNNDGHLDLFHTNGFVDPQGPFFRNDPSVFFLSNGDGTFTETAESLGLADTGMGHGVATLDYDGDGDLDLFISNSIEPPRLYRNDGGNNLNSITVKLVSNSQNTEGIGSRVWFDSDDLPMRQMKEISAGSNFLSQNPADAHFGMGEASEGTVEVRWLSGVKMKIYGVQAGETLVVPELPVSYDNESLSFYQYYVQVRNALNGYDQLSASDAARIRSSAVKAFLNNRYPGL